MAPAIPKKAEIYAASNRVSRLNGQFGTGAGVKMISVFTAIVVPPFVEEA
jgi:hypothetical protein